MGQVLPPAGVLVWCDGAAAAGTMQTAEAAAVAGTGQINKLQELGGQPGAGAGVLQQRHGGHPG